jgi:hypothetical protein
MEVCFPRLCMRRERLATRTRPFQVNWNDEGIAIASSSFFFNAHPSGVVCVGRHGRMLCSFLLPCRADFIQFSESKVDKV